MATGNNGTANLGLEADLWRAAGVLRSNMDAVGDKHVVLGLGFLKYIAAGGALVHLPGQHQTAHHLQF